MKNVLSIQSHVVFGHAGNSAAVFPMRRLGVNAWPLNTVQFSNHTQYGHWTGSAIDPGQLVELVDGIGAIGVLPRCDAVLSGYLGAPDQAQAVIDIVRAVKSVNRNAWYFCDPVMGTATGCRVEPGIQEFLVSRMPEVADAMAPNHSELQRLVGRKLETVDEALAACRELMKRGPKIVLVKHLLDRNSPADRFNMLVVSEHEAWVGQRPLYPFARQPVGVGDVTSAVFVARMMLGDSLRAAFEHTLAAVNAVVKATWDAGRYELELVAAQDQIARPREWFDAWAPDAA
ncbi:pyridoxal kinase PdxY [Paraburkholderia caballeronis]|uniref:Pyridoxal kinase PdxY n=1 Tax=Paraburkholderia caballeronis TaxID=416943 RepID=A0A1H7U3Z4_9BURK|nr:pyridoxal kinase PdxY [Paraburkholderia caballeronis]PXW23486.1 pyridoxal kinase [Paraburkholderia caballeronis]PXW98479.1 pyridoxal kinase [Paraburkholderia caballeronis]RAJ95210.1 pyridoxal kinase [Paraburkholderia caballeronis]TDV09556.1 pyridoxal kinase [Paraburkholderia caballeronis]TDV13827.1 pyridoxal kinase [Paraburkholderia caballeronis]